MSIVYDSFIPENVAPPEVKEIAVFNSVGVKKGVISIPETFKSPSGEKLYSFGAISDIHLSVNTAESDFERALQFFKDNAVKRVFICGDLTNNGNDEQFAKFREIISKYSSSFGFDYVTGNHDTYTYGADIELNSASLTGKPIYCLYKDERYGGYKDDLFFMIGIKGEGALFPYSGLPWLQRVLEEYRDKRCFVFMHCFIGNGNYDVCGNAHGLYQSHCWSTEEGQKQMEVFESLMRHYKNTVWFHGHSHLSFKFQEGCTYANYDESRGYRSVHIPSITCPRVEDGSDDDTQPDYNFAGSEGYLVDVYENGILLRGRDFAKGEWMPIATYWIDTTLQTVEAGTYTDPTGTITT